jgi:hypothetical protein
VGKLGQKVAKMPASSLNVEVAIANCQLTEMMNEYPQQTLLETGR